MSAVRKLVIASVLVAIGLAVAFLLGEPAAVQRVFTSAPSATPAPALAMATAEPQAATALTSVRAQLLPEPAASLNTTPTALEPPALLSSLAPVAAAHDEPFGRDREAAPALGKHTAPVARSLDDGLPIAKLRNEAPRPLGNEPRSPTVIRRMPPVDSVSATVAPIDSKRVSTANADWSGSQPVPANFAADANSTSAATAAFNVPAASAEREAVGPPPWPTSAEPPGPRTHVIVDGDSLQRLASRYLDDPQRGREIYELNRDVLTNPDLLPIGAELKIPERVARSSWGRHGYRSSPVSDATIRSAANGNLVPIRLGAIQDPYEVTAPRAVLASPIAID